MKKTVHYIRNTRGFTLVETLAVVAILVILLGVSAVAVSYYHKQMKKEILTI